MVSKKDTAGALESLNKAVKMGAGLKILTEAILEDLRHIILLKYGIEEESPAGQDYDLEVDQVKRLIALFDKAGRELKGAVVPQIPLELAIVEWGEQAKGTPRTMAPAVSNTAPDDSSEVEELESRWQKVLTLVKQDNHSVEGLLKSTKQKKVKGDKIIIEVFYKFHKNKLEAGDYVNLVEKRIEQVFGKPLKVEYILRR